MGPGSLLPSLKQSLPLLPEAGPDPGFQASPVQGSRGPEPRGQLPTPAWVCPSPGCLPLPVQTAQRQTPSLNLWSVSRTAVKRHPFCAAQGPCSRPLPLERRHQGQLEKCPTRATPKALFWVHKPNSPLAVCGFRERRETTKVSCAEKNGTRWIPKGGVLFALFPSSLRPKAGGSNILAPLV